MRILEIDSNRVDADGRIIAPARIVDGMNVCEKAILMDSIEGDAWTAYLDGYSDTGKGLFTIID